MVPLAPPVPPVLSKTITYLCKPQLNSILSDLEIEFNIVPLQESAFLIYFEFFSNVANLSTYPGEI